MSSPLRRLGQCSFITIDEDELDTSAVNAHVLDDESTKALIVHRHPWEVEPPFDGETLLHNLSQLAPAVAEGLAPKSKAINGVVFRLVNDIDYAEDESSYIAMSYCWKKATPADAPRKDSAPVGCFGWIKTVETFPLPTTPAMFQAVLGERVNESEGLWFDQVCINQEDEAEKAVSIGAMDAIYKNARTVVIALDDITAEKEEVAFLRRYNVSYEQSSEPITDQPNRGLQPPFMQQQPLFRRFFERVLGSLWFERAWCGHEMRLGRSHVFLVPCKSEEDGPYTFIRFTGVFFLHMLFLSSEVMSTIPGQQARKTALHQLFTRRAMIYEREAFLAQHPGAQYPPVPEPHIYVTMIAEVFQMKAGGNPRLPEHLRKLDANKDKLSIVLNSSGLPISLRPPSDRQPPSTEDECLRQALIIGLAARDPVSLCTTGLPLQRYDGTISWLCRPTPLDIVSAGASLPRFPSTKSSIMSLGSHDGVEYAHLDLVFLDLPHRIDPDVNGNWQHYLQRSRIIITLCIQLGIQSYTMWSSWQSPGHPRAPSMTNAFVQLLACCFACGPVWTAEVCKRFQIGSLGLSLAAIEILFNPYLVIQELVATPQGQQDITLLINFLSTLVAYGIPWASGANEKTCGPMIVSVQTAGQAIIFAPFEFSKSLMVAVPEAVKSTDYDSLSRGWIVTPRNAGAGAASWVLRAKSVIFGDNNFNRAMAMYDTTNPYRVYGPGGYNFNTTESIG